jgi:glutamine amidotransferase
MRVTVLDYGAGNIHSIAKALSAAGGAVSVESDPLRAIEADLLVLPGVGAFGHAADCLSPARERVATAIRAGLPTLGVCLGMQLLFDSSEEGVGSGLGVFRGRVTRLSACRSPQIGWNNLEDVVDLAAASASMKSVYYANSFACRPEDLSVVTAWSTHESDRFPAIVRAGTAVGVQFHPEKSSAAGIAFLRAVLAEARR